MYLVAGNSVFGQWFSEDLILSNFKSIPSITKGDIQFDLNKSKLVAVNWSYNIFQIDDTYYLTGSCGGKENQIIKVPLLDELTNQSGLIVAGNDYNLIIVNNDNSNIYVLDLETNDIKKVKFNIETPMNFGHMNKRPRRQDKVIKVVTTNNCCLYLTEGGLVYMGTMPSLLDTSHCEGKIIDVLCGYEHYVILTDKGRVYTWGNGRRLQLGHGDLNNLESPTEVEALAGIKIIKISTGGWHTLALSEYGDLYTWGWNDTGQLGIRPEPSSTNKECVNSYTLPTLVDLYDENEEETHLNVKDIACGSRHSVILLEDNTLWCTGYNKYGQLGLLPDLYPVLYSFDKALQCQNDFILQCGPWTTVLIKN